MTILNSKHLLIATSALALTACGSATTGTANTPLKGSTATNANAKIKTVDELLEDGDTLSGKGTRLTSLQNSGGKQFQTNRSFSYKKLANDKYEFTVGDEKFEVSASDFNTGNKMYLKDMGNGRNVLLGTGTKTGKAGNYKYVDFLIAVDGTSVNGTATSIGQQYAVIGNKTQDMSTLEPTATYSGEFTSFLKGTVKGDSALEGNVSLNVNFKDNSLTGSFNEIKDIELETADKSIAGKFDITNGTITNNGYTATLVADEALNTHMKTTIRGDINGAFYGANADETGGDLTFLHGDTMGTGAFAAGKN